MLFLTRVQLDSSVYTYWSNSISIWHFVEILVFEGLSLKLAD